MSVMPPKMTVGRFRADLRALIERAMRSGVPWDVPAEAMREGLETVSDHMDEDMR